MLVTSQSVKMGLNRLGYNSLTQDIQQVQSEYNTIPHYNSK